MRISDWSSDVCSSDLAKELAELTAMLLLTVSPRRILIGGGVGMGQSHLFPMIRAHCAELLAGYLPDLNASALEDIIKQPRSEEHTSELQSLMRISYAVFCLKKKNTIKYRTSTHY